MAVNAALVGFGAVARYGHLPWYLTRSSVNLVGLVEPTSGGRAIAQDLLPSVPVFSSIEDLLTSRQVSFVDITAPPAAHGELIRAAARLGVHVICEKPFVADWATLQSIEPFRYDGGPVITACHNWHFAPAIHRGLGFVADGLIGRPESVYFSAHRSQPAQGADHWNPTWRQSTSDGGGIIADLGYHGIYLASRIFGGGPVTVKAISTDWGVSEGRAENAACLELDYGDGRRAEMTLTWLSAVRETTLFVQGSRGCVSITGDSLRLTVPGERETEERFELLTADSWHAAWIGDTLDWFLGLIQSGRPNISWPEVEWSVSTLDAAYTSLRSGAVTATPHQCQRTRE